MTTGKEQSIVIPQMRTQRVIFRIEGITPLIVHAWSEKAKKEMRDKQQKAAKTAKAAKDPEADFEGAKYLDEHGRDCFPSIAFKSAIVSAARLVEGVTMTILRNTIFTEGELIPIEYDACVMREDMVRVGMGTADIRYRPMYTNWRANLPVQINTNLLSLDQVVNLVKMAGFSVGVGEWRPEKDGNFGRFDIADQVQS